MIIGFNMKQFDVRLTIYFDGSRKTVRIEKPIFDIWLQSRGIVGPDISDDEKKRAAEEFIENELSGENAGTMVNLCSTFSRFVVSALLEDIGERMSDVQSRATIAEGSVAAYKAALSAPSGGAV